MYGYDTPEDYGDTFFMYVFDANQSGLATGGDYTLLGIPITDGDFVCRAWKGAYSMLSGMSPLGTIQVYGMNLDQWFDFPVSVYSDPEKGMDAISVLPEKVYFTNSNIRFDLANVEVRVL